LSHIRFIEKADCKLFVRNDSVTFGTYKIKGIFPLTLDFAAYSSHCSWILSNFL